MEPVSLGAAAAVLLASKFGEGFAKNAGDSTWHAVARLRELVAAKFRGHSESGTALADLAAAPTEESKAVVAACITAAVQTDPAFAAELERWVSAARSEPAVDIIVAQAFDDATQVTIRGDNTGTINIG